MSRDSSKHVANLNIYKNVYMLCSNWFMKTKVPLPNFYLEIYNNNKFIQRIVTSVSLPQVQIVRLQERKNIHNDIKVNYLKNKNKFHTNKNNNGN